MSYRPMYATAGLGQVMYATAGTRQYATAGLGTAAGTILKNTRGVQQVLLQKGFSVGSTGADGVWGRNSRAAYDRAVGPGASANVRVSGSNLELPEADWHAINSLPNRAVRPTAPAPTPQGGGSSPSPSTQVDSELQLLPEESGMDWMGILPWAAGGVAVLGLGGFLIYKGRKARAVKPNRRRRRRSSRRRR